MKTLIKFSTILFSCIVMASCAGSSKDTKETTSDSADSTAMAKDGNILVAYFSATGVTKKVAEEIATLSGGTLFEIMPEKPYTKEDLDWKDSLSRSTLEMKDKSSRPAIENKVEDFSKYDVIFIGFPVWWYTCPTIVNTFLESYDFKGKTVVPFATSGGSPIEPCVADIEKSVPGAKVVDAKLWNNFTKEDLEKWIKEVK